MSLVMEPIAEAEARADMTLRWTWGDNGYPGPYDPGAFVLWRAGQRWRGQRMEVDGSTLSVEFDLQPMAGDTITAPAISDIAGN